MVQFNRVENYNTTFLFQDIHIGLCIVIALENIKLYRVIDYYEKQQNYIKNILHKIFMKNSQATYFIW